MSDNDTIKQALFLAFEAGIGCNVERHADVVEAFGRWYDAFAGEVNSMTCVMYEQYGKWSVTAGFANDKDADRHADLYLRGKGNEHKRFVTLIAIPLPAGATPPISRDDERRLGLIQ